MRKKYILLLSILILSNCVNSSYLKEDSKEKLTLYQKDKDEYDKKSKDWYYYENYESIYKNQVEDYKKEEQLREKYKMELKLYDKYWNDLKTITKNRIDKYNAGWLKFKNSYEYEWECYTTSIYGMNFDSCMIYYQGKEFGKINCKDGFRKKCVMDYMDKKIAEVYNEWLENKVFKNNKKYDPFFLKKIEKPESPSNSPKPQYKKPSKPDFEKPTIEPKYPNDLEYTKIIDPFFAILFALPVAIIDIPFIIIQMPFVENASSLKNRIYIGKW
ncbi:MAG: hypothetical protein Ta2D_12100 [Rickettsiales bacterium]|nr:MAG: hypothetical protein Ta2D_12100 [Rickettsiales bacterium]